MSLHLGGPAGIHSLKGTLQETTQHILECSHVTTRQLLGTHVILARALCHVDGCLRELGPRFEAMYARTGQPSVPPEQLLRALLVQVLYSVRSERLLVEQLD
ncbi:hypothetical protein BH23GEM5_BH23GEM5_24110 [soil metagenome]